MPTKKKEISGLNKVIQDYHSARDAAQSAHAELEALSEHHREVLKELKTLRGKIEHSNAVIQELRSKRMRGLSTEDDLTKVRKEHQVLLDALNETLEMDATAQKIALPLQQQVQKQRQQLERFSNNAWDAVAQQLYADAPPLPEGLLKAYAAAKRGTFPPGSLGAWLDEKLGTIDDEEYARDAAVEFGL